MFNLLMGLIFLFCLGCGIKSKPLPPLTATTQEIKNPEKKEQKK